MTCSLLSRNLSAVASCLLGLVALDVDFLALGFGEIEGENIEDRKPREGKEDDELFFAG